MLFGAAVFMIQVTLQEVGHVQEQGKCRFHAGFEVKR
jgi:hypothetical protein